MKRQKCAFTLVELLTVMAILALLISILIPSLSAARRSAKANVCLSHLKGIGNGFSVYLNENEDNFPPHRLRQVPPGSPPGANNYVNEYGRFWPRWQWFIKTDFGPVINPTPFKTDIDTVGYFHEYQPDEGRAKLARTMTHDTFTCPALDDGENDHDIRDGAFGFNYQYLGNAREDRVAGRWDNFSVGQHRLRSISATVLVADSRGAGRRHGPHSYTLDPPRLAKEQSAMRFGPTSERSPFGNPETFVPTGMNEAIYAYSPAEPRHNDQANVLFVDAHAEAMTLKSLGYHLPDAYDGERLPRNTAVPVQDPVDTTANNKLFNGDGTDPIAHEANTGSANEGGP